MDEQKVYYFTFGDGQENGGHVQPIFAKNMTQARAKMFEVYGDAWSFSYTAEEWEKGKQQMVERGLGFFIETEMTPIYAK